MAKDELNDEESTATVVTPKKDESGSPLKDVTSDPALDDHVGSDWSDEGGATPVGPASAEKQ